MTPEAHVIENLFWIVNKQGEKVPFKLNYGQRQLDENVYSRNLVPKSRQQGVSRYVLARFTAKCLGGENESCVIISHEAEATKRLLLQCRFYLETMNGPKPIIERQSENLITFPKTNSMIYIGTAGAKKFGRGDTIRRFHGSEYAYWPNPEDLLGGALQAVPVKGGEVWIESTGNGSGNDYHNRCKRAWTHQSVWKCHFLSWLTDPDCNWDITPEQGAEIMANLNDEWDEPNLVATHQLTASQIAWRRYKLEELNFDTRKFKQEYPATFDECFQTSVGGIFVVIPYEPTDRWRYQGNNLWLLDGHPDERLHYSVGVDPSGGVEKDNAVIEVFCLETEEQVGEFISNKTAPDTLAYRVADVGKLFNNAYVTVESNNYGITTLDNLRDIYPPELIHDQPGTMGLPEDRELGTLGYRTTLRSKPLLIGELRTRLARGLKIHSPELYSELTTFIEDENGKLHGQDGTHDDTVLAAAMAMQGWEMAALFAAEQKRPKNGHNPNYVDPFSLDAILKSLRRDNFPIRYHGSGGW